ncbi:MAG TPA: tyrosine-type recombinase/integrase [Micromonosporaceae bacterium]|nr:tyrosine-type recombinase/integrase [Micromonosporaceae bacterium]
MNTLHERVEQYLAIRRSLGFKLDDHGRLLPQFVTYLDQCGVAALTVEAALTWAITPQGVDRFRWRQRLSVVRGFARWLQAFEPATQVPPADLLAYRRRRPVPYLFAEADIDALLAAVTMVLRHPLRVATHRTLFGLLAVTGMREGEAIGLDRGEVDLAAGWLTIREAKFNKSRRLPLHPSTVAVLRDYAAQRDRLCPRPSTSAYFISVRGRRLTGRRVRAVFTRLAHQAGLAPRGGSRRPRVHDLRHGFAVATLLDWYRDGGDVAARMPLLSAYLGHARPSSTYWYLQAAPELLALAAKRLEPWTGVDQ